MLHRAIITLVVTLLVPVCAQDFVLQPGQVLPLTFTVPENATATDQRISVTAGPGTDASIRCTPTSVTNGTWFWESTLPSGAVERLFITSSDPAFAEDPTTAGNVNCEVINTSQPPRTASITVSQTWTPKPTLAREDQSALQKVYTSCCGTNGKRCPGWPSDWCAAKGQVCDITGHLVQLSFAGFNMSCEFPYISIAALPGLRTFVGGEGQAFTGDWDKALFALSNRELETLVMVNNNNMEGSMSNDGPVCALAQTSLTVLDLYNNSISGEIPPCILNGTSKLQYIRLGFNKLSGSIPDVFVPNTSLAWFTAPSNQLTGNIPASMGSLSNLYMLNLTDNRLSGPLPSTIGNAPNLMHVIARSNSISGQLPDSLASHPSLITIDFRNNMLTSLPTAWYSPSRDALKLQAIRLANNSLSGAVPAGLPAMPTLLELNLAVNAFNGTLPINVNGTNFPNMLLFNVSGNNLDGPIPEQYSQMRLWGMTSSMVNTATGLVPWTMIFDLSNNVLSGDLPAFMGSDKLNQALLRWTTVNLTNAGSFPNGCQPGFRALPGACNTTNAMCAGVQQGVDYEGSDLAYYSKRSRAECCALCIANVACEFWVSRVDGSEYEGCFLKNNRGAQVAAGPGYMTGIIAGRPGGSASGAAYTDPSGAADMMAEQSSDGGLSAGAIVGIVIGVLAGVALLAVAAYFAVRRYGRPSVTSISGGHVKTVGSSSSHKFERFEDTPTGTPTAGVTAEVSLQGSFGGQTK